MYLLSVPPEYIPRIYLVLHIVQTSIIAVCDDSLALRLKSIEVVHHSAAKECATIFESGFVDNYLCALGIDTLNHALDGGLAEVVTVTLHRKAVDTNNTAALG